MLKEYFDERKKNTKEFERILRNREREMMDPQERKRRNE